MTGRINELAVRDSFRCQYEQGRPKDALRAAFCIFFDWVLRMII